MSIQNQILLRLITAALFVIAAIFNLLTSNITAKIAGLFFVGAALSFLFSAFSKMKSQK